MLYEDKYGRLWLPEEAETFSEDRIEELGLHVFEEGESPMLSGLEGCLDCELSDDLWRKLTGGNMEMTV